MYVCLKAARVFMFQGTLPCRVVGLKLSPDRVRYVVCGMYVDVDLETDVPACLPACLVRLIIQ